MKNYVVGVGVALLVVSGPVSVSAQSVSIGGDVPTPITLAVADVAKLAQHTVTVQTSAGSVKYTGAKMADVLGLAGLKLDDASRPANGLRYVVVGAVDPFRLVVSLLEFDPAVAPADAILAITSSGAPLPKGDGAFRLVMASDKRATRWVKAVNSVQVATVP